MSSAPTPEEIARDAHWLVQALDPDAGLVRLVEMHREAYRQASFLDDRMLHQGANAHLIPWAMVAEASAAITRRDARWIFHIGHVGSTLLARLLGELPNLLSVREPRFLRDLAAIPAEARGGYCTAAQALFSRTFSAGDVALVKATSFVSEIAADLVPAEGRVLFMYAAPARYVASILAGENSVKELHALAPMRAQRLATRISAIGVPGSDAELAAAAWACEMSSLEAAADRMSSRRIGWLDFDLMLEDIAGALTASAELFDVTAQPERLAEIAAGPLMRRYSKALEFDYSPSLRRDVIANATLKHRTEIDDALAMLRRAADKSPLLARSLARCGEN